MPKKVTAPLSFRSGFVAVVGRPSVGKSHLVNALLHQKVAAVSPRPQTTRHRQLGILTLANAQLILVDTPGLHKPVHRLGVLLNQTAQSALEDADAILWVVAASQAPTPEDSIVAERLAALKRLPRVFLALNKTDLCDWERFAPQYQALLPQVELCPVSALQGKGVPELQEKLVQALPEGPAYYDEDQVTDLYEREIASDLIREAALTCLQDEVPHAIAIRMDEYTERENGIAYIAATLIVERDSQKAIVIGKGGAMLKTLGSAARKEIESLTGRKVFLELRVKVSKNWRDDPAALKQMGFIPPSED